MIRAFSRIPVAAKGEYQDYSREKKLWWILFSIGIERDKQERKKFKDARNPTTIV